MRNISRLHSSKITVEKSPSCFFSFAFTVSRSSLMQREIHMSSLAIFSNKPKSEQNKKKTSRMHDVIRFCVNNRSFIAIVLNEKRVDVNFHRDFQGGWVVEGLIKAYIPRFLSSPTCRYRTKITEIPVNLKQTILKRSLSSRNRHHHYHH